MTDLTATAAKVGRVYPQDDFVLPAKLYETVTAGQAAYQTTAGTFGLCDTNASGLQQFRGIFLQGGGAGQTVPLLIRGCVEGLGVSSLNGDAVIYASDTAGALADAAGTLTVIAGRVFVLPNGSKVAFIDAQWAKIWA